MADTVSGRNRARVGGSGFTMLTFGGQPLIFAQQVSHTSATPVGSGPVAIHPMDEPYPVEVITPAASNMGSITLRLYELYGSKVWERLGADLGNGKSGGYPAQTAPGSDPLSSNSQNYDNKTNLFNNAVDLVDVFVRQAAADPSALGIVKYIRPPSLANRSQDNQVYTEEFHGCVITNITDGEQIEVGTMEILKEITIAYRYTTRNSGALRSAAWDLRSRPL